MIYILIIVLIIVLAFLLYQQKQRERVWQQELANLTPTTKQTETEIISPSTQNDKPLEDNKVTLLPFQVLDDTEQEKIIDTISNDTTTDIQDTQPEILDDINVFSHHQVNQESDDKETVYRETISLEEATRFRNIAQQLKQNELFQPDVIIEENNQATIISPDDPNIVRIRQRTRQELQQLLQIDNPTATQKITSHQSANQPESQLHHAAEDSESNWSNTPQSLALKQAHHTQTQTISLSSTTKQVDKSVIDIQDIQQNLLRQRTARQHRLQQTKPKQPESNTSSTEVLAEIPADEVWANLTKSPIPKSSYSRRHIQSKPIVKPVPAQAISYAPTNTVLIQPEYGVAIAEPVFVQPEPLPEPELLEPIYFSDSNHDDVVDSNQTESYTKLANNNAWQTPDFQAAYQDDAENTVLSEQDFTENYQQTNQASPTHYTSWASNYPSAPPEHTTPPLSLLLSPEHNPQAVQSPEALLDNSIIIEEKLAEFRVKVKVLDAYAGPVITRYEIEPDVGVRGNSVLNLEKDLARSLGVAAIRVVETIPGKTCMGLELPNPKRQMIRLSEIFNSPEFSGSQSKLTLALGQDISGAPVVTDLARAPHLLVAGTTGSGKSVGVNSMILSMLYKSTPEDVRMIMIDPKMLELSIYEGIPHLLAPVVTDMKLAANALTWCVNEMEKRYRLMSHVGVRNLAGYNQKIREAAARGQKIANPFSFTPQDAEPLEKLPFIVVVVDEFADLMMVAGKQIEQLIARLAQKARAAGIHLILATQRPSVDVITGLIKANIPTRIAFQVSTKIDSRTILDQMGAENLLGQGDMLFLPPGTGYPQRVHGAFVADSEVHAVVEYLKQFGAPDYIDEILMPEQEEFQFGANGSSNERDPLFDQAVEVIIRTKKATISSLQRHLRIGYNKAATIIDQLEAEGIVSAADHTGKRTILSRSQNDS